MVSQRGSQSALPEQPDPVARALGLPSILGWWSCHHGLRCVPAYCTKKIGCGRSKQKCLGLGFLFFFCFLFFSLNLIWLFLSQPLSAFTDSQFLTSSLMSVQHYVVRAPKPGWGQPGDRCQHHRVYFSMSGDREEAKGFIRRGAEKRVAADGKQISSFDR